MVQNEGAGLRAKKGKGEQAKRAGLLEDSNDEVREMATDVLATSTKNPSLGSAQRRKKQTSEKLAAETFTRCVKVFSRLILDKLTVKEAMRRWKDVDLYEKSMLEDGGVSYREAHMSLQDMKTATIASSAGLTTRKMQFSLQADFDMEAEDDDDNNDNNDNNDDNNDNHDEGPLVKFNISKRKKQKRKKKKLDSKPSIHTQVLGELRVGQLPNEDDVMAEYFGSRRDKLETANRMNSKVDRIVKTNKQLTAHKQEFGKNLANRIELRKSLKQKFGIGGGQDNIENESESDGECVAEENGAFKFDVLQNVHKAQAGVNSLRDMMDRRKSLPPIKGMR